MSEGRGERGGGLDGGMPHAMALSQRVGRSLCSSGYQIQDRYFLSISISRSVVVV